MGNADEDASSSAAELDAAALTDSELTTRIDELERRLAAAPGPAGQDEAHDLIRRKRSAGELRWERFGRSGDLADAQQAWLALSDAVDTWMESPLPRAADPELYAALCYDLAVILQVQALVSPGGDGGDEVAKAITGLESAVKAAPGRARYRAALASALLDSAEASGDRQQFIAQSDRAIELFREVVPAATGTDPDARAAAQCDLATIQVAKFTRALGVDDMVLQVLATSDLDDAIDVLGEAAATAGLSAELRTRVARAYANTVSLRATRDQHLQPKLSPAAARTLPIVQSGKLGRAEELLHALTTDGDRAGDTAQLLVDLLLKDWELCRRPAALTDAEAVARDAVAASAPAAGAPVTEAAAGAELALARVLAARPMDATGPDLAGPTTAAFQAACDGYQQLEETSGVITASRQWAAWGMKLARWPDAAEAFGREAAGVQAEIKAAVRERDVFAGLKTMTGVASDAAFARALAGDPAAAIEGLESDRAMFYRALLADAGRGLGRGGTLPDLTARFPDTALVFLVPASVGGIALIAAPGEPPHAELLPELTAAAVEVNIGKFWGALTARQWRAASDSVTIVVGDDGVEDLTPQPELDALTSWLWTAAMRRVIQLAGRWPRIALIPTGRLVSAPLHAAWRPDPSAVTGRRYAIDDALIGYLPTAGLGQPLAPAPLSEHARLLVVADPSPCSAPPLYSAAAEAAAAAGVFPDVTSLAGGQATREHVLAALPAHDVAHLICHGRSDPEKPLDTHLLLSNDEHLSVGDLIDRDLSALRLAVLSACESASPSTHLPEAAISLPAALLAAGVSGVVGTLWEAADAPTSVLMARFYQALREPAGGAGLAAPAQALRAAQRWVRDTTNSEKETALPGLVDFGPNPVGSRLAALRAKARTPMLHWAGFLFAGR